MAISVRYRTLLILLLTAVFVYLGWLNLEDRGSWKNVSDGIHWHQTEIGLRAAQILDPEGSGPRAGLQVGDLLLQVQGIPIRSTDDYTEVTELLAETLPDGTPVSYQVRRPGGEAFEATVALELRSQLRHSDFFLVIVALGFLGIGLFIYVRNWKAAGALHFYFICLVAFILFFYRHSGRADPFDLLIYWLSAGAFLLLPPLFLHFCFYFPEPLRLVRSTPRLKPLLYLPATSLLIFHAFWFSGSLQAFGLPRTAPIAQFMDNVHLTHFIAYLLAAAFLLQWSRSEASSVVARQQMKWITKGALIGVMPFCILYGIPYLLGLSIHAFMEASVLGLLMVPLSFAYAITRYRLMDVELIFKKGASYFLATSALLILYVGLMLASGHLIQGLSPESGFVLFALGALLVAILFAPLKNAIQDRIDRYFYKEQFDYRRSFAEFGRTLTSEFNLPLLVERISERIRKTFQASAAQVFVRDETQPQVFHLFRQRIHDFGDGHGVRLEISERVMGDLSGAVSSSHSLAESSETRQIREQLSQLGVHYIQPMVAHGQLIGFLGLGKKDSGDLLSSEDLELIGTLGDYAAIAVDNALLYRSLEFKAGELAQLKVYSENVIESIPVGVAVVSPDGKLTVWNGAMEAMTGFNTRQALGKELDEVFPESLVETLRQVVEGPQWMVSGTVRLHKTHLSTQEEDRLVNVTLSPFFLQENVVTGTLLVFDDITEKVRLESQLLQAEKLSSIGLFAAGVAHEVNTPLAGISSYAQMLLRETPEDDPRREMLQKIEKQSFRASGIINNLLNFARFSESDLKHLSLNSLMLETVSLLDHQFKKGGIDVKLELDPSLPQTMGHEGKLQQVFVNLFLNARDAMPRGGELRVKSYQRNSALILEVQDTGTGISPENIKRIYDPFFTTKDVGKGTGLGLSVSYGIVQEHSGTIHVDSTPGQGSTFVLQLPVKRVN